MPSKADVVWDVRFQPNPHFVDELRPQTGLDRPVQDYVYGRTETVQFLEHFLTLLDTTLPAYENEGKSHLTIAIGCTGGKHRSVAISERVSNTCGLVDAIRGSGIEILEKVLMIGVVICTRETLERFTGRGHDDCQRISTL